MEQIQDKRQLIDASTPGKDEEQYSSSNQTGSTRHNKSVLKKVKDKAKKLKASIISPNKHNHDSQPEIEEALYDHYSKAEDNSSEDKKAEITRDSPRKELPDTRPDQTSPETEIDWSSPGAYTRAKGFGPRSSFLKDVQRVRSHEETVRPAAGEEPAAIAPLPASVQAINTHYVSRKADQSLDATPHKDKNVHSLDQNFNLGAENTDRSVKVDEKEQDGTSDGDLQDPGITGKIFDAASTVKNVIFSKLGYESGQSSQSLEMNQDNKLQAN